MSQEGDDKKNEGIFSIPYSLPVMMHSLVPATRTPSYRQTQPTKFTPDYGGVFDIPGTCLKQNNLLHSPPFEKEGFVKSITPLQKLNINIQDCLQISPTSVDNKNYSYDILYLASGSDFHVYQLCISDSEDQLVRLSNVSYRDDIQRVKRPHTSSEDAMLIFDKGLKVLGFDDQSDQPDRIFEERFGVVESKWTQAGDGCQNPYTKSIVAMVGHSGESCQIRMYDLNESNRLPYSIVSWQDETPEPQPEPAQVINLRWRMIRTFIPTRPTIYGAQRLEHVPNHLCNMLVTTGIRVAIVDPRVETLAQTICEKSTILSCHPTEYFRRSSFSCLNQHTIYCMSNVHLRAFDTRYLNTPMNQLNHMLEASHYESMSIERIDLSDGNQDLLCMSAKDKLCYMTFERSGVVNPKSIHYPYHSTLPRCVNPEREDVLGLSLRKSPTDGDYLFFATQVFEDGRIIVRKHKPALASGEEIVRDKHKFKFFEPMMQERPPRRRHSVSCDDDLAVRDVLETQVRREDSSSLIDVLCSDLYTDIEDRITSKRAMERFEKMRTSLDRS